MARNDVHDRLLTLTDENLLLKKSLNTQRKDLKRLQTQIQRLESSQKEKRTTSPSRVYEERIQQLEKTKKCLEERVDVLKQQLHSHSRLHAQVHRTLSGQSIGSAYSRSAQCPCAPSPFLATDYNSRHLPNFEEEREREIRSNRDPSERNYSANRSTSQDLPNMDPLDDMRGQRNADCELNKVVENIELIRLKRLLKRQAAQLAALSAQSESSDNEIKRTKDEYKAVLLENECLSRQLNFERQKVQNMVKELSVASTLKHDIRVLEEQLRDLMQERVQLKDHNEQLLNLAACNTEESQNKRVVKTTGDADAAISADGASAAIYADHVDLNL